MSNKATSILGRIGDDWFLGLAARFTFASVLLMYFINSGITKVSGSAFPDFLIPGSGAYAQMLPTIAEKYNFDVSQIPLFPYKIIAFLGMHAEFVLPVLIVLGLFTRLSSLAMIGFIAVKSYVDIYMHGADQKAIGAMFDITSDSKIADLSLLWVFILLYLVVKGAGLFSLDSLLCKIFKKTA